MDKLPLVFFQNKKDELTNLVYVVIAAKYDGKWIFVRHRDRLTWEMPGGHIEDGEDYMAAARRELYEETGDIKHALDYVSPYTVEKDGNITGGYLFYAEIEELGPLPQYEIEEITFVDVSTPELTYPHIQPHLLNHVQNWLNLQSGAGELWDVYDKDRRPTGRTHRRGEPMNDGDYHIVASVWLMNKKGEFLITKRSPNKGYGNLWENTCGSALAGDDSLAAAIRETKEETGLDIRPEDGRLIMTLTRQNDFFDIWFFVQNINIAKVVLQEGETCDAMLATKEQIFLMMEKGEFVPVPYFNEFLKLAGILD